MWQWFQKKKKNSIEKEVHCSWRQTASILESFSSSSITIVPFYLHGVRAADFVVILLLFSLAVDSSFYFRDWQHNSLSQLALKLKYG